MPTHLRKSLHTFLLLLVASLAFHGCARYQQPPAQPPPVEKVKSRPQPQPQPQPPPPPPQWEEQMRLPEEPQREIIKREEPAAPVQKEVQEPGIKPQQGPARSLYQDAEQALKKGDSARAEMLLERALRIEPRNGWYWNAMGRAKYSLGATEQAIQFWKKSKSLAGKDTDLIRNNDLLLNKAANPQ
ncbi:MAG: hypothetical protein P4L42_08055 [Desulfocapsaceae bacterium]|nr:hypothetical protein [Desulfocapsaceae bacterium]